MSVAPFVASPFPVVRQMLILAELKPKEILYDLGSGDGRVVIMAAQDFGAIAVGIEMQKTLVKRAQEKITELHLEPMVRIVNDDFFQVDISPADVVTLYLTTSANTKIKPKLETELKPGVRVVSHDYEIVGWKPLKVDDFSENEKLRYPSHKIFVYKKP